jgi:hypothetical protein
VRKTPEALAAFIKANLPPSLHNHIQGFDWTCNWMFTQNIVNGVEKPWHLQAFELGQPAPECFLKD